MIWSYDHIYTIQHFNLRDLGPGRTSMPDTQLIHSPFRASWDCFLSWHRQMGACASGWNANCRHRRNSPSGTVKVTVKTRQRMPAYKTIFEIIFGTICKVARTIFKIAWGYFWWVSWGGHGVKGAPIRKRSGKLCQLLQGRKQKLAQLVPVLPCSSLAGTQLPGARACPSPNKSSLQVTRATQAWFQVAVSFLGTTTGQLDDVNALSGQGHTVICAPQPQTDPDCRSFLQQLFF